MAPTDQYRIDGHKLNYHIHRVSDWLQGKDIAPIYMEISPSGICNHRCTFCSVDFMGYQRRFLPTDILKERLTELGRLGLKSIMYAGEGEPFLHKDFPEIVSHTRQAGIDVAITTNGVLMRPQEIGQVLASTEWIKVSCNAGTPETYADIHRTKAGDFDRVIENLRQAVILRAENGYSCTLGIQMLLLPENESEAKNLSSIAREIGLDYMVIKPYTHHALNRHKIDLQYEKFSYLDRELQEFNSDVFQVIFRARTMQKWDAQARRYDRCLALPFWSYIDAGGNVWGCSARLQEKQFLYGNITEQTFRQIWQGTPRKESLRWVRDQLDISTCKLNCRMDEVNLYLWDLTHPPGHVNFI